MRTLSVNTFVSVDGVMQAPGGPGEDDSGGFPHGGWSVEHWDGSMGEAMDAYMSEPFDLLLGRRTYEIFAGHWPNVTDDPTADALNGARKYVASRTLREVSWENSTLLEGDAGDAVAALKQEPGPEIQVHGSANLLQTLLARDLIDVLRVWTFPVVLGSGKRLFEGGAAPRALRLADSMVASTGVVLAIYERAGELSYGSFELD